MSRPFAKYPAKPAFAEINEPLDAGDYIKNKKTKYAFCPPKICYPNQNVYSQSNLMTLKRANNLAVKPCENLFNYNQLYSSLYSKLDLIGVPVIVDLSTNLPPITVDLSTNVPPLIINSSENIYPIPISPNSTPYLTYCIDPTGLLFGDTLCGIYNFRRYIVFKPPC
jgi:hypothetical protein